ncbi:hypothetical protein [Nocardia sputi]|uniref:hypothetical protein n=1 Tax=Nocardia sputi TaxID=2943705 RepID=UPI0020BEA097|nr:hypothetical protein [Nocardia sputi]
MSSFGEDGGSGGAFLVDWDQYSQAPIFKHLTAINFFRLTINFPRFKSWDDSSKMGMLADCVYEEAYELLARSGLYSFDQLNRTSADDSVGVHYKDADADFRLQLTTSNELSLTRPGSSMKRFYEWYRLIMPEVHRLYEKVREFMELSSEPKNGTRRDIIPARAGFSFKYILHDFHTEGRFNQDVKNSALIGSSMSKVPGPDGKLIELDENQLGSLGRIDLAVSRWIKAPGGTIREIYSVEAPGNLDYGTIWADFHYLAETRDDKEGRRVEPDFSAFLRRFDHPVTDFLRDRALKGYLSDLTDGVEFKTTPGLLP